MPDPSLAVLGEFEPIEAVSPRRARLSALVLARDEAENLPGCLAALDWADERIVVVDPASRDATEEVAHRLADRVIIRSFDDFASQRNAALEAASGDWVLAVDADERATPELVEEIAAILDDPRCRFAGFRVPIVSVVLGRAFRFSGTQHDRPLRLFRRELGFWVGEVHETVDLVGDTGTLRHALKHRTIPDIKTFLSKIDRYTTLEAIRLRREGKSARLRDITIRPIWVFAKLYVGKQGFRDGIEGFLFCVLSGFSLLIRHAKQRELERREPSR